MRRLFLLLALGCTEREAPPTSAPAPAAQSNAGPAEPTANRWTRTRPREADPEAKALYRRAVDLATQGNTAQARALLDQIAKSHPNSRFAVRLQGDGSPAALAAVLGLAGAAAVPLLSNSRPQPAGTPVP